MATIFYSVGGEGRGHATRVRAVVEDLRREHAVFIYAPAHAYELLEPAYRYTEVEVRRIPGIISHYSLKKQLNYLKTGWHGIRYAAHLPRLVFRLQEDIEAAAPDLVITDFEPALPRAAQRCGVPYLSLNHQHFLATYDLSSLPLPLRRRVAIMERVVQSYYSRQVETIVSSFYFPPLRPEYRDSRMVTQIGVLLCPEIVQIPTDNRGYLVAYLRRFASHKILEALAMSGREVRVYGLGSRPPFGTLRFFEIDVFPFIDDLANCEALICTSGNQLVGEALFLGKPVLAMPEPNNHEQYINGHFLNESGAGISVDMEALSPAVLKSFLDRLDELRSHIDPDRLYGNPRAIEVIRRHLPPTQSFGKLVPAWRDLGAVA
jgi:uncharacterized protein (TIGR00661 family)